MRNIRTGAAHEVAKIFGGGRHWYVQAPHDVDRRGREPFHDVDLLHGGAGERDFGPLSRCHEIGRAYV